MRNRYTPRGRGQQAPLDVTFSGEPLRLGPHWTIDVQTGDGHSGRLAFLRFERTETTVDIEEISWEGLSVMSRREEPESRARRTSMAPEECAPLLEAVCLLPTMQLREPAAPGYWFSSASFFVLIRAIDSAGRTTLEKCFAGGRSATSQTRYLPLLALCDIAYELLERHARWTSVPTVELRSTHYSHAFICNVDASHALPEFGGWVAERSVNALAHFGNSEVVQAIAALQSRSSANGRLRRKIQALLERPEHWLAGKPKPPP